MTPRLSTTVTSIPGVLLLAFAGSCGLAPRPTTGTATGPSLRVALLQFGYWSGGFERPLFIALADGTVLFPRTFAAGIPQTYARLKLTPEGTDSLLRALGIDSTLATLDTLYDYAPGVTDQHSFYLLLPTARAFSVLTFRAARLDTATLRPEVPAPFREFVGKLRLLSRRPAEAWTPDSVQFEVWPYEYAPDNPPLAWPSDLPQFTSARWHRRKDPIVDEVRSLRLPFAEAPRLDSLMAAVRSRQALKIGGRKWAFSYRWIFPAEGTWWSVSRRLEY